MRCGGRNLEDSLSSDVVYQRDQHWLVTLVVRNYMASNMYSWLCFRGFLALLVTITVKRIGS